MEEKVHAVRAGTADTSCHCRSMATSKHSTIPSKVGDNNRLDVIRRIDSHQRREARRQNDSSVSKGSQRWVAVGGRVAAGGWITALRVSASQK